MGECWPGFPVAAGWVLVEGVVVGVEFGVAQGAQECKFVDIGFAFGRRVPGNSVVCVAL